MTNAEWTEPDPTRTCLRCGTSWVVEVDECPNGPHGCAGPCEHQDSGECAAEAAGVGAPEPVDADSGEVTLAPTLVGDVATGTPRPLPCRNPDHPEGLHYHPRRMRGCGLTVFSRPASGLGSLVTRLLAEHWPDSGVNAWYLADLLRDEGAASIPPPADPRPCDVTECQHTAQACPRHGTGGHLEWLKDEQAARCTYGTREGDGRPCDCKYGAPMCGERGEMTGCPELRAAIRILARRQVRVWHRRGVAEPGRGGRA